MLGFGTHRRTIHVHIGPHKTGSTAIQHALRDHAGDIADRFGATVIHDSSVWALAKAVNKQDEPGADAALTQLVRQCAGQTGDLILSCEDLAGHLPGRGGGRRIYAHLWPNLNRLRRAFRKDTVVFYFFMREPETWLRSAYVQLLKYRTKFKSFDGYLSFLRDTDQLWDGLLARPRDRLGAQFVTIPYQEGDDFSAARAFLDAALGAGAGTIVPDRAARPNTSPDANTVRLLELANRSGASHHAVQAAKACLLDAPAAPDAALPGTDAPPWPPVRKRPDWLAPDLEALWSRVEWRAGHEPQPNLMPDPDADLAPYRTRIIDVAEDLPDIGRERMEDQAVILKHRLRNLPESCYLLGLAISYLRRHTGHEAHASALFQRLWRDEHAILLGFLPTRWLISTFQTFLDHGTSDTQRMIGAAAFFFTNTIKMYEAERALDGLPTDGLYANTVPVTKAGFWGLDRYSVGGTDMLLNINAHMLELAAQDAVSGRVVQEFLLRLKRYDSAFSRMDMTRLANGIDKPPFSNCWSFFDAPKTGRGE